MATSDLTAERVRELFNYHPETGLLTRRIATGSRKQHRVGSIVGTINDDGYLKTKIDGITAVVHRVIWLHVTGQHPPAMLDHIDGCGTNNRWSNLRETTNTENQHNRWHPMVTNNSSRLIGIQRSNQNWRAVIYANGNKIELGSYKTKDEAAAAYLAAKKIHHPSAFTPVASED